MKVLGIIPARGGSKGVPRKNIKLLAGRPLLAYTAEAALAADALDRVVLSTEDVQIAEIGSKLGLEVPFLRPAELAQDETPTLPVVQHAVRSLESRGCHFDAVCLLQPTNPLRTSALIDECIGRFVSSHADSVVTVLPVPHHYNPHWVFVADDTGALRISTGDAHPIARRQELPPAYHRDGSVYVTRRDVLMDQNSLLGSRVVGCLSDPSHSVNVDTPEDFARAEQLITRQPWPTLPASAHYRPTVP